MKIGIFDSGLGGLFILKNLRRKLPKYSYLYLGDTKNLPYGEKTQDEIYHLTINACNYLFEQNCELIIIACNTVSAEALRKIQQEYLPKSPYRGRKVLGIIRPTVEAVSKKTKRVGIIGTESTINSGAYVREFENYNPDILVFSEPAPKLVPLIESDELKQIDELIKTYLSSLIKQNINVLILGCTHYAIIKSKIRKLLPKNIRIISQEIILPGKLKTYLKKHPEIQNMLTLDSGVDVQVTKNVPLYANIIKKWFGSGLVAKKV